MNECCFKPDAYIGIDPGISKTEPGASALLYNGGFELFDWKDEKNASENFRHWSSKFNIRIIAIERQWPRPNDSKQNIGKIMKNYGFWVGLACAFNFHDYIIYPTPQEWQKATILVLKNQNPKEIYLKEARKLFPMAKLKFKKHNGRAAALFIADYARRHHKVYGR